MAKQDKYVSAYSPRYNTRVKILNVFMSKHCDWLFSCEFMHNDIRTIELFAESQLIDFKEKEECQPLTMLQVID